MQKKISIPFLASDIVTHNSVAQGNSIHTLMSRNKLIDTDAVIKTSRNQIPFQHTPFREHNQKRSK